MTTPIEITPQMRQAVLDAECERLGHPLNSANAMSWESNNGRIRGPAGKMPHLTCDRCGHVWIVLPRDGRDYAQAEQRFRERLRAGDPDALPPIA